MWDHRKRKFSGLLKEVQTYLSGDIKVRRADVLSAWQGFRPLASDPNAPPGAPVSRDHVISTNPKTGVTFITGGKWTTYREMAEDVVDQVVKLHNLQNDGSVHDGNLRCEVEWDTIAMFPSNWYKSME